MPNLIEKFILSLKNVPDALPGLKKELESRTDEPKLSLQTLPHFNRKIWGLKIGLTIIGARTSMGKSSFVTQIAYDLAMQGHYVLFLSLEMTVENIIERLFCNIEEVDNFDMLCGKFKLNPFYQEKWQDFEQKMEIPLKISCGIGRTFEEINKLLEFLEPKPEVIIVDYIQMIRVLRNEREEMNEYIRKFREICIKNNIAGILCSQLNRKVVEDGDNRPQLSNLKSSGFQEEHADTVILLNWEHFYNWENDKKIKENDFRVYIAKQRNGRIGDYLLYYEPQYYKFKDSQPEETFTDTPDKNEVIKIFGGKEI